MAYSGIIVQRVLCCRVGPVARDSKKPRPGCACGGLPVFCGWVIGRGGDIPAGDLAGVMQQAQPFALAAAAVPWPTTCLSRSLALCWFLRRQGVAAEVQLGVRPRPGGLEAHAWVVWQGAVLNDTPDVAQRYTPLSLPMAR